LPKGFEDDVNLYAIIRRSLLTSLVLGASVAWGQHGGGPGGGGGGMGGPMGGGGMAGMGRGMSGNTNRTPMGGERGGEHFSITPTAHIGLQLGLPGRWWDEKKTMKTLSLRSDQKSRMDEIFNANKATLSGLLTNLQHEELRLSTMSSTDLQDETKVYAAIDRFEAARADLEKENAHVLLQIRQQLDPDQLTRLDSEIASLR
jgi:Spy/CpxP family protein refolding chaperone